VRVVACHADAGDPARLGFVRWAEPR